MQNTTLPDANDTLQNSKVEQNYTLPTLESSKVEPNHTLQTTIPTLESGKVEPNHTLQTTIPTLENSKVEPNHTLQTTLPTLETSKVEPNQPQSATKVVVKYPKWLKPTMTVSANEALRNIIAELPEATEAENFTSFVKALIDSLEAAHTALQTTEAKKNEASIDAINWEQQYLDTLDLLQNANDARDILLASKKVAPIAPPPSPIPSAKRYGIFSILNNLD
jgi:hypothetical protein